MSTTPHKEFDSVVSRDFRWYVNGDRVGDDEGNYFDDFYSCNERVIGSLPPRCPFCKSRMELVEFADGSDFLTDQYDDRPGRSYWLISCPQCSFWEFEANEGTSHCIDAPLVIDAHSVARKFDSPLPEGCTAEIAQQLRRDPSFWHTMAPRDMERFVADLFRANHRHAEVMHVGKPGDLGVDVLFIDADGKDWLIQVKRRESPGAVEGFDTLQRLLGTLVLEGKLRGIIASTAERFSRPLLYQKRRAEQRGYTIELLDRGKLDRMLSPVLPVRPWLRLLGGDSLSLMDAEIRQHFVANTSDPRQTRLC